MAADVNGARLHSAARGDSFAQMGVERKFNVDGHQMRFLHAPDSRLQSLLLLINRARRTLRFSIYMFHDDSSGTEVRDALVRAVQRGVAVQLLVDSFGSSDVPDAFFQPISAAGGKYCYFSSRWRFSYFIRNHQKLLVVDGICALVGGFNVTDQYFGRRGENSWEDIGLEIEGPEVARIDGYLEQLIAISIDGGVRLKALRRLIRNWQPGTSAVRWLVGGPTNRISPWALTLKQDLQTGRDLDIVAAYFSPSQTILRRIAGVGRRGGRLRMIMAGRSDNGATIGAARILYNYLLERGATIAEFHVRLLHVKLLVLDDVVYVGSANLDVRSLFINKEIMLRIDNKAVADHMRGFIETLQAESKPQFEMKTGWLSRVRWSLAYLLVNTFDYDIGRRLKFRLSHRGQGKGSHGGSI